MFDEYLREKRKKYEAKVENKNLRRLTAGLLIVIAVLFILAVLLICGRARASEEKVISVEQIESAIIYSVQPYQKHPVVVDSAYRKEIAKAIRVAASEFKIPPLFLVAVFQRESSFRRAVIEGRRLGSRKERGLGQVNGVAKWWCTKSGFDLKTIDGQARCSAGWLDRCRKQCDGSLEQGFARYATGRSCSPRFAGDTFTDRFALWKAIENRLPLPKPPRRN